MNSGTRGGEPIRSAAVADYRPDNVSEQKLKKSADALTVALKPTIDILATVAARPNPPFRASRSARVDSAENTRTPDALKRPRNVDNAAGPEFPSWPLALRCQIRPTATTLGQDASFSILDGVMLAGGIPAAKVKLVQAWIEIHRNELVANWELAVNGQPPFPVDPLRQENHGNRNPRSGSRKLPSGIEVQYW